MRTAVALTLLCLLTAPFLAAAQPLSTSGQVASTSCKIADGTTCAIDGSTNEISRSLTYSPSTGKFTGTIITNLCSNDKYGRDSGGNVMGNGQGGHTASCKQQTFPAPAYTGTTPIAAPLRGNIGYSLYGVNIFGPFEAGFSAGQGCDVNAGTCDAGVDIATCEAKLAQDCGGTNHVRTGIDSCGGHATPYHYHIEMKCDETLNSGSSTWTASTPSGHSPLVGIMLDGRGLYGLDETTGKQPTDLDACGGHVGPVPVISLTGITGHSDASVYHYHTQAQTPFLLGCYGPAASVSACSSLYSTCGAGYANFTTINGAVVNYDLDCPCVANTATSPSSTAASPSAAQGTSAPATPLPSTSAASSGAPPAAGSTSAPKASTGAPPAGAPTPNPTLAPAGNSGTPAPAKPTTARPANAPSAAPNPSVFGSVLASALAAAAALLL